MRAEVLPADKAQALSALWLPGTVVAMVCDGISDAPALAAADVGIAMAAASDVPMHTARITLMRGAPLLLADAINISRRTYTKNRQNLFWAFFYSAVGIPLAALGRDRGRGHGVRQRERGHQYLDAAALARRAAGRRCTAARRHARTVAAGEASARLRPRRC